MFNLEEIRKSFSILREADKKENPYIYLDSAATSLTPDVVVNKIVEYYQQLNTNIHRSFYQRTIQTEKAYDLANNTIANFINAEPTEIIYSKNASTASNMLVQLLVSNNLVREGDTIVVSLKEHHSNFLPWIQLKKFGINVEYVSLNEEYQISLGHLEKLLKKSKVAYVVTGYVSNVTGAIHPVQEIIQMAHNFGAKCVVDATQAIPHFEINIRKMNADYMFFSGHKILGPTGIGVLYGRQEYFDSMDPYMFGGGMVTEVIADEMEYADIPQRFEVGTPDIAGVMGLGAAINYIQKIGYEEIWKIEEELKSYLNERIRKISHLKVLGPKLMNNRIACFSFACDVVSNEEICFILDKYYNIAIRSGKMCAQPIVDELNIDGICRISCYFYNTIEEIDAVCSALEKITKSYI